MDFFNAERLLICSPKALGEVLVKKNYDFVKPARFRRAFSRILGEGILLAEGEEHKVSVNAKSSSLCLSSPLLSSHLQSCTLSEQISVG